MDFHLAAELVAATATVCALLLAVWQLRQNSRLAGRTAAAQMWMEYLRLGLENPDLGETRIALKQLKIRDVATLLSGATVGSQRYLWFLTVMLDACENLMRAHDAPHWTLTVQYNLSLHREALVLCWPVERICYSPDFRRVVDQMLAEPGSETDLMV